LEKPIAKRQFSQWLTRLFKSSVFRIYLVYTLIFTFSVLIVVGFFYWLTIDYLQQQAKETVNAEIRTLEESYKSQGFIGLRLQLTEYISNQKPGDPSIYLLTDNSYRTLIGNLDRWPAVAFDKDGWMDFPLNQNVDGEDALFRAMAKSVQIDNRLWLMVGQSLEDLSRIHEQLTRALLSGLLLLACLALGGGVIMRGMITRRLDEVNRTSRKVMLGNIKERVRSHGTEDEFDQLSNNLNNMLDEIEQGMENVRRVSDNIAHDLKTPLARIKNRLEELRVQVAGDEVSEIMVNKIAAQADGLLETFNALLRIGRIEASQKKEGFKLLNLVDILHDVNELYGPVIEEAEQTFEFQTVDKIPYHADRDMIFQAICNLLDNASKFTPKGGTITLKATKTLRKGFRITVSDTGKGIPESEFQNIAKRFYRVDSSRTTPGSGLGLSLVSAIAQLHDIELQFHDNQPGLAVELIIPRK
jgi:signal transduction histidine kinase